MAERSTSVLGDGADSPVRRYEGQRTPRTGTVLVGLLLVTGLVAWAVAAGPLRHTSTGGPSSPAIPMGSASVVRTDVAEQQQVSGTLGYAGALSVLAQRSGTLTAVATPGHLVGPGGVVAEIDDSPVVLMVGARPAWRDFATGMSDGPDVRELETGLRALGFDPQAAMTVDDHFSATTAAAVRRWQRALRVPQTGVVPLGSVAFVPRPMRVTVDAALPGALVGPGQPLVSGTTTDHEVTVALDTARQGLVHTGDHVVVTMPDGRTTTPGVVTFVSQVAVGGSSDPGAAQGGGQSSGQGGGSSLPTVQVTVALTDQRAAGRLDQAPVQVAITDQLHTGVLAVPVTALLATPGGGYAVTPAGANGAGRADLAVTVGLFDDLSQLVEVSGAGLSEGMRVQVPLS